MAFKIATEKKFTQTVTVYMPISGKQGQFDKSTFSATFRNPTVYEVEELRDLPGKAVMQQVMVGFSDLLDDEDQPVEFNEVTLSSLLEIPQALNALTETFWKSLLKAPEKN